MGCGRNHHKVAEKGRLNNTEMEHGRMRHSSYKRHYISEGGIKDRKHHRESAYRLKDRKHHRESKYRLKESEYDHEPVYRHVKESKYHRESKYENRRKRNFDVEFNEHTRTVREINRHSSPSNTRPYNNFHQRHEHEHTCNWCKRVYVHYHPYRYPNHQQFNNQCPNTECKQYHKGNNPTGSKLCANATF